MLMINLDLEDDFKFNISPLLKSYQKRIERKRSLWRQHPDYPQLWVSQDEEIIYSHSERWSCHLDNQRIRRPKGKLIVSSGYLNQCKSSKTTATCSFNHWNKPQYNRRRRNIPVSVLYYQAWPEYKDAACNQAEYA